MRINNATNLKEVEKFLQKKLVSEKINYQAYCTGRFVSIIDFHCKLNSRCLVFIILEKIEHGKEMVYKRSFLYQEQIAVTAQDSECRCSPIGGKKNQEFNPFHKISASQRTGFGVLESFFELDPRELQHPTVKVPYPRPQRSWGSPSLHQGNTQAQAIPPRGCHGVSFLPKLQPANLDLCSPGGPVENPGRTDPLLGA